MVNGALTVDNLLATLTEQHNRFLKDATAKAMEALKAENMRLSEEIGMLKAFFSSKYGHDPPPIPQMPDKWPCEAIVVHGQPTNRTRTSSPQRGNQSPKPITRAQTQKPATPRERSPKSTSLRQFAAAQDDGNRNGLPGMVTTLATFSTTGESWDGVKRTMHRRSLSETTSQRVHGGNQVQILSEMELKHCAKERLRLRRVLGLPTDAVSVSVDVIFEVVKERNPALTLDKVQSSIQELKIVQTTLPKAETFEAFQIQRDEINFEALLQMLLMKDVSQEVSPDKQEDVAMLANALCLTTMDEVIDDATKCREEHVHLDDAPKDADGLVKEAWETPLNFLVIVVVFINIFSMGFSVDYDAGHAGWFVLEVMCTLVFVAEAVLKIWRKGWQNYFQGVQCHWNIADLVITVISVFEVCVGAASLGMGNAGESTDEGKVSSAARVTVLLRALRLTRLIRLMKLIHSPILRDLANMLVGFVIGIPSLIWVCVLFSSILYMVGLVFRLMFGPDQDQDLRAVCGEADDLKDYKHPVCKVHYIYGEEFFGTVAKSMFTTFRFMLGDYSTRGGKSIVVAFSEGYGPAFEVVFVGWMIVVIFGLFNIITAIFVDSTTAGLKHNDVKRKYARQYENHYVKDKLRLLMARVQALHSERGAKYRAIQGLEFDPAEFNLVEEEFNDIMDDPEVRDILVDLDVDMFSPSGLFDTFDPDGNGKITAQEFVQAIMKLRGEPQKNDVIALWVSLRAVHEKFDDFRVILAKMETRLESPSVSMEL